MLAGALLQVIQTQPEPRPLCTVIVQLMTAASTQPSVMNPASPPLAAVAASEAGTSAASGRQSKKRRKAEVAGDDMPNATSLAEDGQAPEAAPGYQDVSATQLPLKASPLASLAAFAAEILAAPAGGAQQAQQKDGRPTKKRKQSAVTRGGATMASDSLPNPAEAPFATLLLGIMRGVLQRTID